mgnify:CR=1 FL=1
MEKEKVFSEVQVIFNDVFSDENIIITENSSPSDIEAWDSLQHIVLLLTIEKKFNIKFHSSETQDLNSVKLICNRVYEKLISKTTIVN